MIRRLFSHYIAEEVRPMIGLAVPIVLAELGWVAMGIVDMTMVGRQTNSAVAIAAVSLGTILYYVVAIFGTGLMLGLDTLVSQSYGAGDLEDAHRSLVNGVYLSLALTPVLMGLVRLWEPLLGTMDIPAAVREQAIPYLRAINWSTLPLLLYFVFRRYLQAMDLAKPVMFALVTANLVNLAGNWMFIYGHGGFRAMGTVGSGWATCSARIYMVVVLMVFCLYWDLRRKSGLLEASRKPHLFRIWQLIRLGFPAATQMGLEVGVFAVAAALIARMGAVALAGHQIALVTATVTYMVPLGIGGAASVRVGQALGRNDALGASRAGWTAIALGEGFMSVSALVFLLFPRYIVRFYTPDLTVIDASVTLVIVAGLFQLFDGLQVVATGALRGAGDTRTPMICTGLFYWLVGLPVGYVLGFRFGLGAVGFWIGFCVALILIGSALLFLWRRTESRFAAREAAAIAVSEA
jgi:MATE family multidrug resistance protein